METNLKTRILSDEERMQLKYGKQLAKSISYSEIEEPETLSPQLKELTCEAQEIFAILNSHSNKVRQLESTLRDLKLLFPFSIYLPSDEFSNENAEILWEEVEDTGKFRIFIKITKIGESIFKRALLETNLNVRLKYIKYVDLFIEKYKEYLKNQKNFIKETLMEKDNG